MNRRHAVLCAALLACAQPTGVPDPPTRKQPGVDILFIGNSLTYVNDLPGTLEAMARAAGDTVRVAMVAEPDLALIDHVNGASNAVSVIRAGGWEYVVLQQAGTSTGPGVYVDTLIMATRALDAEIKKQGGRTALFMTWPSRDRVAFFDNTLYAYRSAAEAVGGIFLPAGEAWRTAWRTNAALLFYSPDGLHPSVLGTYVAALVIYEGLMYRDVRTLPSTAMVAGREVDASDDLVRMLQASAHQTVVTFAR